MLGYICIFWKNNYRRSLPLSLLTRSRRERVKPVRLVLFGISVRLSVCLSVCLQPLQATSRRLDRAFAVSGELTGSDQQV